MLNLAHPTSRRSLLRVGAMSLGGLTLPGLLRAERAAGKTNSRKAIILVHLDGGPPQMDTIDPKPLAPAEIRGEFHPIATKLEGLTVCELLPRLAKNARQFSFLRTVTGSAGRHDAFQCQSGFSHKVMKSVGGRPAMGSVVARLKGTPTDAAPPFVDLMQGRPLVRNSARPGFLGPAFGPFRPDISKMFARELEDGMKSELARLGNDHATKLELTLPIDRLRDRQKLRTSLDRLKRDVDSTGMMSALDGFSKQAATILTSGRLAKALDLSLEDPKTIARYTPSAAGQSKKFYTSEGPKAVLKFLLARRLVEAGARVVSISISDFDTHSNNFPRMRQLLPLVDHGLTTLVDDLTARDLIDDVTVLAWGEFGRTPRINAKGGRDHWPRVGPAIIAGGGLKSGVVIGKTDRSAGKVVDRPVSYQDVFATLYRTLGINARQTTINDPRGRPQYLLDEGQPIRELIS